LHTVDLDKNLLDRDKNEFSNDDIRVELSNTMDAARALRDMPDSPIQTKTGQNFMQASKMPSVYDL